MTAAQVAQTLIKCQTCPAAIGDTESLARAAGWRLWSGLSIGGVDLDIRLCPHCAGTRMSDNDDPDAPKEPYGFNAECATCGLTMWEDYSYDDDRDGEFAEDDAKEWVRDHTCEPEAHVIRPKPTVVKS